jgi:hypothetical protein
MRQFYLRFRLHISDILFHVIPSSALVYCDLCGFHCLNILIETETRIVSLYAQVIACGGCDPEHFLGHMGDDHKFDSLEDEIGSKLIH